jgi:hypothetical protein
MSVAGLYGPTGGSISRYLMPEKVPLRASNPPHLTRRVPVLKLGKLLPEEVSQRVG